MSKLGNLYVMFIDQSVKRLGGCVWNQLARALDDLVMNSTYTTTQIVDQLDNQLGKQLEEWLL